MPKIKKGVEYLGHEVKEGTKSVFKKLKKSLPWYAQMHPRVSGQTLLRINSVPRILHKVDCRETVK
jgi:hypothetical protein